MGVEISRGRYVIVGPDGMAPFVPLATKSIDVEQFVDRFQFAIRGRCGR
jgi:DNA end-binding protein Ku